MPIDTHLDATPSDITASATAIGNIKSHVDSTEDDLISARKSVCELEGSLAMAASGSISTSVADCESLVSNLGSYKTALDNLASALSSVKTDLQGIRDQTTAGGLLLNGETVYDPATVMAAPADGGGGAGGGSDSDAAAKTALYKNLETQASDIRLRGVVSIAATRSGAWRGTPGSGAVGPCESRGRVPVTGPSPGARVWSRPRPR